MDVLDAVTKGNKLLLANPHFAAYAAVFDFLLFWSFGLVRMPLASKSGEALTVWLGSQGEQEVLTLSSLLIDGNFVIFLGWFLLMLIVLYVLYCAMEGMAWFWTHKAMHKAEVGAYMKQFFRASMPWAILFFVLQGIAYVADYMVQNGAVMPVWVPYAYDVWLIGLLYFAGIQYSMQTVGFLDAVKVGVNRFTKLLPALILLYVIARAVNLGLALMVGPSMLAMTITSVAYLVWIVWTRMTWAVLNV
ncbi:MAG: hypothetical protein ACE5FT_01655 [Candidatus Nanoarchaeia archaeon]